jgi:hypothetical protein
MSVQMISFNASRRTTADGQGGGSRDATAVRKAMTPREGIVCGQTHSIGQSTATTRDEESAMTPPDHAPKPGTRDHFLRVSRLQRWGTIQEVDLCRTHGYFT